MSNQPNHETDLIKTIRDGRAVIVAGTGVSIAASFDAATKQSHPQASWSGLLEDGLYWLKDHDLIDKEVADAQLKLLERDPQTHWLISTAEDVTAKMGGTNSSHFADWLKRTVGSIKAHDPSILESLDAIRQQGNILATTNYDGLLLNGQLEPVTWLETDAFISVIRHRDISKIIFLHGYWRHPESVILDWNSYGKIARDERYREDLAAVWKTNIWVFVGCGVNGLTDPDFGLLLERYGKQARQANHLDYCLVLNDQKDEFQRYFDANHFNIRAIPFGKEHADLPKYLRSLLPEPSPPVPEAAPSSVDQKISAEASRIRERYLKDARRDFENRLNASVHHARFIDLGIQDDPAAIKPAWGYHNPDTKQSYDTVAEAFFGSDRRLLLLGSPGSGKTTALLHLADMLVKKAEQAPEEPLPFVVNLSKFQFERSEDSKLWHGFGQSRAASDKEGKQDFDTRFESWLISEMAAFPGLSRDLARNWIRGGRVAVLLDGLDEFNDERRAELARLLNDTFLRDYPEMTIVICSRTNEYLALQSSEETRLQLRGCVQLQPLNDAQIAAYLDAAQAGGLRDAIPNDPALGELAKTPLTLSMLVLAYGGLAPTDLPKTASLSESRHKLFESYVDRMLQRRERRKRNIPFDNSKVNDVPICKYSYHPDKVHRYLGWLALVLSVRMRTSFSVNNFHSILSIGVQPARQPFNFTAVYLTIGALLLIILSLAALPLVPITLVGLLNAVFIVIALFLLLPLAASGGKDWSVGNIFITIAFPTIILLDIATLAHVLSAILPGDISPLLLSVILPFVLVLMVFALDNSDKDDLWRLGSWFIGAVLVVAAIQVLSENQQLPFLDRFWWQPAIVALSFCLGIVSMEGNSLQDRAVIFGILILCMAGIVFAAWLVPEISWVTGLIAVGSTLLLILAVVEVSTAVLVLLGYTLFACAGGLAANHYGAILGVSLFGLLYVICEAPWKSRHKDASGSDGKVMQALDVRLVARSKIVADKTVRWFDHIMLSPCLWRIVAIGRRFPWHRDLFISFCKESFLLKQSSQEYEFIHRLLRDYFALRELRPRLAASDKNRRLDAIRFLGYQGEAALDVLTEFAEDQDGSVRAAALTGLSHIASPIVTGCFDLHIKDLDPLVRQALISGIFKLPEADATRMLSKLKPLGDGCEVYPLLEYMESSKSKSRTLRRGVLDLIKLLGDSAVKPLKDSLQNRSWDIRQEAMGVLTELRFVDGVDRKLVSTKMTGSSPWLDPAKPITRSRVIQCANHLYMPETSVRERYQSLADRFGLKTKF